MRTIHRSLALAMVAALVVTSLSSLLAAPASAATITVTTTDDVVNAGDGVLSLREAVTQADASDAVADTVVLVAGATYQLELCGNPNDNSNLNGDLDYLATARLTIQGSNTTTIEQTCAGDRIIDSFTSPLTLQGLILTGGDEDNGAVLRFGGDVTFDSSTLLGNTGSTLVHGNPVVGFDLDVEASRFEAAPGNLRAIRSQAATVTITDSIFREFETTAVTSLGVGATVSIIDSTFTDGGTVAPDLAGVLLSDGPTHISGSSFLRNEGEAGTISVRDAAIDVDTSTFTDNHATLDVGAAVHSWHDDGTTANNTVELSHVTVWDNTHGLGHEPANVATEGALTAFASIIGQPGAGDSCEVGSTTSEGYNLDRGDSCGFGAGTGDAENVANIGLGAPVAGDGPHERVFVPGFLSPAVDRIPNGDCAGTILDQLGEIRPQDGDFDGEGECDAGAVERPLLPVFTDVSAAHPFYEEIGWMGWQQISTGTLPGPVYKPSDAVSRQAMSAFVYRLADASFVGGAPSFSDVGPSNPFFDEIEWMNAEGITTGFPGGLFKPTAAVTRQSMSAFMFRLAGSPPGPFPDPGFIDVSAGHPFFDEISWMADEGITEGFGDGTYRPSIPVSRQAMSAFMFRLAALFI